MNYILTADEIRTLAAMLGAKRLVGLARQSAGFSREAAVVSVLRLTQRGILKSTEEGLICQKQVRSLMAVVAAPQQCVLVTDVTLAQSQLICYCSGTSASSPEKSWRDRESIASDCCPSLHFWRTCGRRAIFPGGI